MRGIEGESGGVAHSIRTGQRGINGIMTGRNPARPGGARAASSSIECNSLTEELES